MTVPKSRVVGGVRPATLDSVSPCRSPPEPTAELGRRGGGPLRRRARDRNGALGNNGAGVSADSMKMLALPGRNREGVGLESNYRSGPQMAAGESCR